MAVLQKEEPDYNPSSTWDRHHDASSETPTYSMGFTTDSTLICFQLFPMTVGRALEKLTK